MDQKMDLEYGINIKNKFQFLMDDEDDPENLISRAELAAQKKDEKLKSEKKTEKKEVKKAPVAAAVPVPPTNNKLPNKDDKKPAQLASKPIKPPVEKSEGNKENRPDSGENGFAPRGGGMRGRGGGRGMGRGRGGPRIEGQGPTNLPPRLAQNKDDVFSQPDRQFNQEERFGEGYRGRGGRGGGRGFGRGGGPRGGRRGGGMFNSENADGDMNGGVQTDNWSSGGGNVDNANMGMGVFGDEEGEKQAFGGGGQQDFGGSGNFRGGRGRGGFNRSGGFPYEPRGRGGGGGGRGGRGRQFERNSGSDKTGIKPLEKKSGFGNWGTKEDELQGETEPLNNTGGSDGEVKPDAEVVDNKKDEPQDEKTQQEPEEVEKMLTLDEWKAQQKARSGPSFNIRQPETDKNLKVLKTKLDESTDGEEVIVEKRPVKKQVLNIEVEFIKDQERLSGGRGRGDFRGGRGGDRGMSRGGRGRFDEGEGPGGSGERGGFRGRGGAGRGAPRGEGGGGGRGMRGGRGSAGYKMDMESFPELGSATA